MHLVQMPYGFCRALIKHRLDQNDIAARGLDHVAAHHLLAPVIGALDQHRRPHALDQVERRVLVEDDDEVDGLQRGQHLGAAVNGIDRPAFALQPRGRGVAVEPHHKPVAGGAPPPAA